MAIASANTPRKPDMVEIHNPRDPVALASHARALTCARNFVTRSIVACGFSSMTQWPECGTIPISTLVATNRTSSAIPVPKDFSAPMASTGMPSLPPLASSALLSIASWLKAPNCSKASWMACGRA